MSWEVEYTNEFETWWETLTDAEQASIAAVVGLLEDEGPQLGYPYSSGITSSRHAQMRELRVQHQAPGRIGFSRPQAGRNPAARRRQDRERPLVRRVRAGS